MVDLHLRQANALHVIADQVTYEMGYNLARMKFDFSTCCVQFKRKSYRLNRNERRRIHFQRSAET